MSKQTSAKPKSSPIRAGQIAAIRAFRELLAKYRAIETTRKGARYGVSVEKKSETRGQLKPYDRLYAIAMGRDLERNSARTVSMIENRKLLAFGNVKAQLNTENDEWNRAAEAVFNGTFAEDCDYRSPDVHLADMVQLAEAAVLREGDVLIAWGERYTGEPKLLVWEADQLVDVDAADWARQTEWRGIDPADPTDPTRVDEAGNPLPKYKPYLQDSGVVTDFFGKEIAYVVSRFHPADGESPRGKITMPLKDCLVIPASEARLFRRRWRPNQVRGVPLLLSVADNLADANEMQKNELMTAKAFGKRGYFVEQSAASADAASAVSVEKMLRAVEETVQQGGEGEAAPDGDPLVNGAPVEVKHYDKLEEADGNIVEYLAEGDKIVPAPTDRPNLDVPAYFDHVNDEAGAAFGLAQGYARMRVSSSYTAHRGETNLTVAHIRAAQKRAERQFLDWLAVKVLSHYLAAGKLAAAPEGWERKISWVFPTIPNVDPLKEISAEAMALKNGFKNFRDILGADWKERIDELADEIAYIRAKGVPLAVLETAAGVPLADLLTSEDNQKKEE